MSTVAIVQARMGSTRLPNKVMLPVCGVPLIELLVARLALSRRVDRIVLATSDAAGDQPLVDWAVRAGIEFFRAASTTCSTGSIKPRALPKRAPSCASPATARSSIPSWSMRRSICFTRAERITREQHRPPLLSRRPRRGGLSDGGAGARLAGGDRRRGP
jgi:hypothetical protein